MNQKGFTPPHFYRVFPNYKPVTEKSGGGFTILELLIVIAIIGILASALILTTRRGLDQARDGRRIQEVYEIAHALQLYYTEYGKYPANTDPGDVDCGAGWDAGNLINNGQNDPFINPLEVEGFLTVTPREWAGIKDAWSSQCIY
ncbi:MAG: type II secretion system protein [Patescibacteria group bacterium]|nr:type II secretion system protein [Patescibacteria group bacterium]